MQAQEKRQQGFQTQRRCCGTSVLGPKKDREMKRDDFKGKRVSNAWSLNPHSTNPGWPNNCTLEIRRLRLLIPLPTHVAIRPRQKLKGKKPEYVHSRKPAPHGWFGYRIGVYSTPGTAGPRKNSARQQAELRLAALSGSCWLRETAEQQKERSERRSTRKATVFILLQKAPETVSRERASLLGTGTELTGERAHKPKAAIPAKNALQELGI